MSYPSEAQTQYPRRVLREAYPVLFDAIEGQLRYVDEHLNTGARGVETKYDLALAGHLARASKSAMGIINACEYGYGEIGQGALRGLGETMVSAYYMSLDPEARAERFESYAKLEAIHAYRFLERMGWEREAQTPEHFRDEKWIAEVEAQFPRRVDGSFQEPMNRVVAAVAPCWRNEAAGEEEFRRVAEILHFFGDRHSHIGTTDTVNLLRVENGQLVMHLGPGKKWVPQTLVVTAWVYGQMFDLWAEHFELPDMDSWRRRWRLLVRRCQILSPEAVQGVGRNDPCPCGSGFKYKRCHLDVMR
jgi:hypothetical protein